MAHQRLQVFISADVFPLSPRTGGKDVRLVVFAKGNARKRHFGLVVDERRRKKEGAGEPFKAFGALLRRTDVRRGVQVGIGDVRFHARHDDGCVKAADARKDVLKEIFCSFQPALPREPRVRAQRKVGMLGNKCHGAPPCLINPLYHIDSASARGGSS